ncbi:MAG: N-formylglutamate amidohydrolase [Candidatus Latescibacterota bacterium]|jgi:N-formylglutamate amidohydrolase
MRNHDEICTISKGEGPLVAAAIHDGHAVRPELVAHFALSEADRLREEDPHTGSWTGIVGTRIIGTRSRFQVDLNRPPGKAVYRVPEDAWGLEVWKDRVPEEEMERSRAEHPAFYDATKELLDDLVRQYGCFFVFDLHSYNHRREGPDGPAADPETNPEVNIGTGTMDRDYWAPVVDRLISQLQLFDFMGRRLDVRENVKFRGGYFSRWIHETFPQTGCAVAIEFKKFFMDEWTGELDEACNRAIRDALTSTVPVVDDALARFKHA